MFRRISQKRTRFLSVLLLVAVMWLGAAALQIPAAAAGSATGWLDYAGTNGVSGWAYNGATPNTAIYVHVHLNNLTTGQNWSYQVTAGQFRQDLLNAGYGNGNHGFSYDINWALYPPGSYSIVVYGIDYAGNPALSGCPKPFTVRPATGNVEAFGGNVSGWAMKPDAPAYPIQVHINVYRLDGTCVWSLATTANLSRPDVGAHGFSTTVPWASLPQEQLRGTVYAVDNSGHHPILFSTIYNNAPLVNVSNGTYTLWSLNSGRYLDVTGATAANNTNVEQYAYNGGRAQQWYIERQSDGYYKITSLVGNANTYVLDVNGGSIDENDRNVAIYASGNTDNQRWYFVATNGNGVYICPKFSATRCLDVQGANTANGANVALYNRNGGANQLWNLDLVDGTPLHSGMPTFDIQNVYYNVASYASAYQSAAAAAAQNWLVPGLGTNKLYPFSHNSVNANSSVRIYTGNLNAGNTSGDITAGRCRHYKYPNTAKEVDYALPYDYADILIDPNYVPVNTSAQIEKAQGIIAHEMGHAFGLGHNENNICSIMQPYYTLCDVTTVQRVDNNAFKAKYP